MRCDDVGFLVAWLALVVNTAYGESCNQGVNYPGGDLPGMPVSATEVECASRCNQQPQCWAYVYHQKGCSDHGEHCTLTDGCCWLKQTPHPSVHNKCTCASVVRPVDTCHPPTGPMPPAGAKNVLYILVDDLRPELPAYGQHLIHAPHLSKLAASSLVFDRAYCQEAVCSPSRMSFLSGRRPDHTRTWNFINHFRQASCGIPDADVTYNGPAIDTIQVSLQKGGAGQCCTTCTTTAGCGAWSYTSAKSECTLRSSKGAAEHQLGVISGPKGTWTSANWTAFPQRFRQAGYFTLGTGKVYHTEEGGITPPWDGPGMPPNEDPPSWTPGCSMSHVNADAPMLGCKTHEANGCAVNATEAGVPGHGVHPLCDKTIGDDAVKKLLAGAAEFRKSGRPFFVAAGFRKPHMAWRFPEPFLKYYPSVSHIRVAKQPTMDVSVPPIAHHDPCLQGNPYQPINISIARWSRLYYYSAVSWVDSQVGRVLDTLEKQNLVNDTVVLFHSDHGWSLGEHGQWQKFTNWELGVRVPLMIRAPWIPQSQGKRTKVLAELVDVYPTTLHLAGVAPPPGETLDGTNLTPVLLDPGAATDDLKPHAISQYPRCPKDTQNTTNMWKNNWCEFVDRTLIPFMGYSMRTARYRYTEWVAWDGTKLLPVWSKVVGRELYDHEGDDGTDFDRFETKNIADGNPRIVGALSQQLHAAVNNELP